MDLNNQNRIQPAWEKTKKWITGFDGSPTITLLTDIPFESLIRGITQLSDQSENLRITNIPAGDIAAAHFISLELLKENLEQLRLGKNDELAVNWAIRHPAFELDIHSIIHPLETGKFSMQLEWWSDQVFSDETDNPAQFMSLAQYFFSLQTLFSASYIFLSKESGLRLDDATDGWIEV